MPRPQNLLDEEETVVEAWRMRDCFYCFLLKKDLKFLDEGDYIDGLKRYAIRQREAARLGGVYGRRGSESQPVETPLSKRPPLKGDPLGANPNLLERVMQLMRIPFAIDKGNPMKRIPFAVERESP